MKFLKYSIAGILIGFGSLFLLASLFSLIDDESDQPDVFIGCIILGAPPLAGGVWLLRATQNQNQNTQKAILDEEIKRRQAVLYRLVDEKQGEFTLIEFAMAASLPGDAARDFLQEQARLFGADYRVTEQGDIVYVFKKSS